MKRNFFTLSSEIPQQAKIEIVRFVYRHKEYKTRLPINSFTLSLWETVCQFRGHIFKYYIQNHKSNTQSFDTYNFYFCERCLLIESEKMHTLRKRKEKIKSIL